MRVVRSSLQQDLRSRLPKSARQLAAEVEQLRDLLLSGANEDRIKDLLSDEISGLRFDWSPSAEKLPTLAMNAVLSYWQTLPKTKGVAEVRQVDPEQLRPALGYIMLVDVGESGCEFRYALYGSKISAVSGFDLTGKSIWEIPTVPAVKLLFAGCYLAVALRKAPLYTVHDAPPTITINAWHRLILPLGKGGEVRRYLVCNQPLKTAYQNMTAL